MLAKPRQFCLELGSRPQCGPRIGIQCGDDGIQQIAQSHDRVTATLDAARLQHAASFQRTGKLRKVAIEPPVPPGSDLVNAAAPVAALVELGWIKRPQIDVRRNRFLGEMDRRASLEPDTDHEHKGLIGLIRPYGLLGETGVSSR